MSNNDSLIIKVWKISEKAQLPVKATSNSIGYDLYTIDSAVIYPGETAALSTGLIMKPPNGYHIRVYARSGFGKRYGVGIPHGVGIIDPDYCGPDDVIKVILHRNIETNIKHGTSSPLIINAGERVAQLILEKNIDNIVFSQQENLPIQSTRGGFGSTGKS